MEILPLGVKSAYALAVFLYLLVSLAAGQSTDSTYSDSISGVPNFEVIPDSSNTDTTIRLTNTEPKSDSAKTDSTTALPISVPNLDSTETHNTDSLSAATPGPDSTNTDSNRSTSAPPPSPDSTKADQTTTLSAAKPEPDSIKTDSMPSLLILESVNLATGKTSETMGETLRKTFTQTEKWKVFNRMATAEKLMEYNIQITNPCKEFACAFDAGNMFHSDYVLFSTFSRLEKLYAFNLAIIDIKGSKIAWAHTGDIPIKVGRDPDDALVFRLKAIIGKLSTDDFRKEALSSKGVLGIIDFSKTSQYANLIMERISTHMVASGQFEVMGQSELEYLKTAMGIQPNDVDFSSDSVQQMGGKLGLDYLIYSRLNKQSPHYLLRLALYDVQAKEMIRDWPVQSKDFRKILDFESKFCASLNKTQADFGKSTWFPFIKKWNRAASSVAALTGLIFSYSAIRKHKKANDAFDQYQSANTLQELEVRPLLKSQVEKNDRARNLYIGLSGLLFCGSAIVWYF